jgi:HEAT repeat protein
LSWAGAEHIILDTLSLDDFAFESDPIFPLHFKLVEKVGYVYLCGRGTVTTPEGQKHRLGYLYDVEDLIGALAAKDQMAREASAEGLGWLAKTKNEIDKAVPVLITALKDHAMEVRRNAASSLGKIGDLRARDALKAALEDENEWVREVAADALKKLQDKGTEPLP